MSVTVRSPIVARKTRSRAVRLEESGCWEESVCSGDKLINEHASRISWWLVAVICLISLALLGVIMQHAYMTATTGSWSTLNASTWIQPTPRALASLVGISIVLGLYSTYMLALKKGHLDKYVGQFIIGSVLYVGFWLFYVYGLSFYGSIGSLFSLIGLAVFLGWSFLSGHSVSPLFALINVLIFVYVVFNIVWLATSGAVLWPSP